MIDGIPNCVYVDSDCMEHQLHLSVLGGLSLTDSALKQQGKAFKYYSSLAIFSACARELAGDVFKAWTDLFGPSQALSFAKTLIPRSSAGRWGCVDAIEARLLKAPWGQWLAVLNKVILQKLQLSEHEARAKAAKASKAKNETGSTGAEKVDVLALEHLQEYTARIGRWRRQLLQTINDPLFIRLVKAVNMSRSPIIHLSAFLKKREQTEESRGKLCELVCHKAASIQREFDNLLRHSDRLSSPFLLLQSLLVCTCLPT